MSEDDMAADYDVFVSYARADGARVKPLVQALRTREVRVWFDETEIANFESITRRISEGLAKAKALVAVYSDVYPTRRACQWELTAAFIAAQHEGDPRRRVFVINPEEHAHHIYPSELRDALFRHLPKDADEEMLAAIAEAVRAAAARLSGHFADVQPVVAPPWYGGQGLGSNRFVGRVQAFWQLHSALFANDTPVITAQAAPGHVQIRAMGGMGKSLLAEEYALRFGAAYPGGLFWLKATGDRDDQKTNFAARLGLDVMGKEAAEIEGWLERRLREAGKPYLWVVDDLPGGMGEEDRRRWFAPNRLGKTLITTRSREHGSTGEVIDLGVLAPEDGYELLTARRKPDCTNEEVAAREIVGELGGHALAIDVAGGALAKLVGRKSLEEFLATIRASGTDALALARKLGPDLPNGHEPSIAATLLCNIDLLDESGRDFLRLASVLASDVIPDDLVDVVFKALGRGSRVLRVCKRIVPFLFLKVRGNASPWGAVAVTTAVENNCLAEKSPDGDSVHILVARTMGLYDKKTARQILIRRLAIQALNEILPKVDDIRTHQGLRDHVTHARHLADTPDTPEKARLLLLVGRYEYVRGFYASARRHQEAVLDALRLKFGEDYPGTMAAMEDLALTLRAQGDLAGARKRQEAVFEVKRCSLGEEDLATLKARDNLALTLYYEGDLVPARGHQEVVLEAMRRRFGEEHRDTLATRNNLALTLRAQGDLAGARKQQEAVVKAMRRTLGEEDQGTLTARSNLAATLYMQGELTLAMQHQEYVLEVMQRVPGEKHLLSLQTRCNLAGTLFAMGNLFPALTHIEAVVEISRRALGEEHPFTLQAKDNLARTRILVHAHEHLQAAMQRRKGAPPPDALKAMANSTEIPDVQQRDSTKSGRGSG